jgi:hypothetical protein
MSRPPDERTGPDTTAPTPPQQQTTPAPTRTTTAVMLPDGRDAG